MNRQVGEYEQEMPGFQPALDIPHNAEIQLIPILIVCQRSRTSRDLAYAKTPSGLEVDFVSTDFGGHVQLIQAASDISSPSSFEREIQALTEARQERPEAEAILVTETDPPRGIRIPKGIEIIPVWQWLLNNP